MYVSKLSLDEMFEKQGQIKSSFVSLNVVINRKDAMPPIIHEILVETIVQELK